MRDVKENIEQVLYRLGITANYAGFRYTQYAVKLVMEDRAYLLLVTKQLYPAVAEHFSGTAGSVERNLRQAAALAWRNNPKLLAEMAGHPLSKRPSASGLLAILAAYCAAGGRSAPQNAAVL